MQLEAFWCNRTFVALRRSSSERNPDTFFEVGEVEPSLKLTVAVLNVAQLSAVGRANV